MHMRVMKSYGTRLNFLILSLVLLTLFSCGQEFRLSPAWEEAVDNFSRRIERDINEDNIGSITAAAVKDGKVIWAKGFGWADKENNVMAEPVTIGRTGSISKSFTAILMMVLVEKGVIGLDEPVSKYLPEIEQLEDKPDGAKPVTFRHLASHTAGLIREPRLEGAAAGPIDGWTQKILDSIPETSYQTPPETEYSYSNIGYGILGYTLERAAGKPFMEMMEEYIFEPLGMKNTTFVINEEQKKILSKGYAVRRDGTVNTEHPELEHAGRGYKVPNGGIYSNVLDQAKIIGAMTETGSYKLLTHESLDEIHNVQTPRGGDRDYGLGFFIYDMIDEGVTLTGHSGSVSGYNAYLIYDRESKLGVVMFRNYTRGSTNLSEAGRELLLDLIRNK